MQLAGLEGRFEDGSFKGTGVVDITKSEPQYKLRGSIRNFAWKSGKVDLDGAANTRIGVGTAAQSTRRGYLRGSRRHPFPEQVVRTASGGFGLILTAKGPQFKLSDVQASLGSERFTGDGVTLADGRLQMELASANRIVHVNVDVAR